MVGPDPEPESRRSETRFHRRHAVAGRPLHAKSYAVAKRPSVGVVWKFGDGVPAQTSPSSSDRGSKLRGPSLNSPRVASKRDVSIT
ncbi:hypothetical protein AVEN_72178-1 [Araneus ventricosus]|uniref:Uncharacterized protein n=1 Tax=Araneus ventricosus TaxID=182803 RepID=A0A4Y2EKS4_ARAVE|nr:hypothetical protein AVEN_72178-1 [Araneus ventricosus]